MGSMRLGAAGLWPPGGQAGTRFREPDAKPFPQGNFTPSRAKQPQGRAVAHMLCRDPATGLLRAAFHRWRLGHYVLVWAPSFCPRPSVPPPGPPSHAPVPADVPRDRGGLSLSACPDVHEGGWRTTLSRPASPQHPGKEAQSPGEAKRGVQGWRRSPAASLESTRVRKEFSLLKGVSSEPDVSA